jgi:RNA polymerase sigma factor (TIGR02999 family)
MPEEPRDGSREAAEVSRLLERVRAGEAGARDQLADLVYRELHQLARQQFAAQPGGHTLQPTALVHEAWLKLARHLDAVEGRRHFLALASTAMRQVLIDHARGGARDKRGGGACSIALETGDEPAGAREFDLVAFDDCLRRLSELNPRHARLVELRFLGMLTIDEAAEELGVSHGTVENDWRMARAWLRTKLAVP